MLHLLALLVGVFTCSTAVIWIKASETHPLLLPAYRLIIATVLLAPLFVREVRKLRRGAEGWEGWEGREGREGYSRKHLWRCFWPGIALAGHFITWTLGARETMAANATLIVNLVVLAMPFFLYFAIGERVNRGEIIGSVLALSGVVMLTARDYAASPGNLDGDLWCFVSMLLAAWYLTLGRRNRDFPSIWLYVVPLYFVAGLACYAVAIVAGAPYRELLSWEETGYMLALALVPTIMGHSLLNYCMKHLRGQTVSVSNLGQFIFAAVMAFFFFGEVPPLLFYPAGVLIVFGAVIAIRATRGTAPGPTENASHKG